jgi:hypothetical protein
MWLDGLAVLAVSGMEGSGCAKKHDATFCMHFPGQPTAHHPISAPI